MLASAAAWLDATGVKTWAAGDAYPWINTLHLLGLVMLVGAIGVVDLRIAGAWRALPTVPLSRALTPVGIAGLAIMVPSGILLFAADGKSLAGSTVFVAKLTLVGLALGNAAAFRILWVHRLEPAPTAARLMAVGSIVLWLTAAALGRLIAYS